MSFSAMMAVQDRSSMSGPALLVLLAIARSADRKTGECYLSLAAIAERARVDSRHARRYLRRAEEAGELHTNLCAGRIGVNLYRITIPGAIDGEQSTPGGIARGAGNFGPELPGGGGQFWQEPRAELPPGEDLEGNERREGTAGKPAAAEPSRSKVAASDAGLRPSHEEAAARDAGASRLGQGLPPLTTPFRLHLDGGPEGLGPWRRVLMRTGAAAHAGMDLEWADLVGAECHAQTWGEAREAVAAMVRAAREDDPRNRKPVTPGNAQAYLPHGVRAVETLRRAGAPRTPASKPAAARPPESRADQRARRLAGDLNPLEETLIAKGSHIITPEGDLQKLTPQERAILNAC